ncbi:uncharacterized protein POS17_2136 [Pseudomonas sp. Os17]|uniref:SCO4402 family protein n=1 Tax=Pseudomonas sp. Os17 TaxID=1500686 RepID=UPI0005FC4977|nr:hypothetical protein [Pseudomonas sp. Os17]BAQ73830.1 uncharacterized protein POS17_2136 [Pseudomonas sp. Os17]
MEKFELSKIEYPAMREELISYLEGLSSVDYQYNAWVSRANPDIGYDEFNYAVHFLYDDTDLANDPRSWIGIVLRGESEVAAISDVVNSIDRVFDKYGTCLTDAEYLTKLEWVDVVESSKRALIIFSQMLSF